MTQLTNFVRIANKLFHKYGSRMSLIHWGEDILEFQITVPSGLPHLPLHFNRYMISKPSCKLLEYSYKSNYYQSTDQSKSLQQELIDELKS